MLPLVRNVFLASLVAVILGLGESPAQQKPKDLQWTHAFDMACRKYGENDFTKETQKFGVEAFRDNNNGLGLYISQAGSIGIGGGFDGLKLPLTGKGPNWTTGLDLPAREAGQKEFTKQTKVHAMEVFQDPNVNNWIYVTEKGNLAVATHRGAGAANKAPKWSHSVDLLVRKGGVKEWKDATKYGIEIYKDGNTGNLLYICQTGALAAVPDAGVDVKEGKAPEWLHGLDLACRKSNEASFSKDTRKFGVEVFRDENTGNLIFLSETGSIAVTTGGKDLKAPTPNVKEPQWTHGLNVKCRSVGEKEFSEKTRVFGAEVFRDDNLGVILYISESGNLAAMAKN